jgi:hypothetical protein
LLQVLGKEAEKFGGDTLLNGQEKLSFIRQQMDGWTDNALKVFSRHRKEGAQNHPDQDGMMTLNEVPDKYKMTSGLNSCKLTKSRIQFNFHISNTYISNTMDISKVIRWSQSLIYFKHFTLDT